MNYHYKAKAVGGATSSGVLEAESPTAARKLLRDKGLFALSLEQRSSGAVERPAAGAVPGWNSRVTKHDLLMLTSQLVIMTRSGVELAEAFKTAKTQCTKPALRDSLDQIYNDLADGVSISAAIRRQSRIFGEVYAAGIAAGEASGQVTAVLARMGEMLRKEIRLRSAVRAALAYPAALLTISLVVITALISFVLPRFAGIFHDMGVPMPASTQVLLNLASSIQNHGWIWGIGGAAATFGAVRLRSTEAFCRYRDRVALSLFLVRDVVRSLLVGRTFRLLGVMLQSGVPLPEALQLSRSAVQNRCYRDLFATLHSEVLNGRGLGQSLSQTAFIPADAAHMAGTGERTGKLGPVLEMVGEFYEDDGERRLQELMKLLEPAIVVIMGIIVGIIVASVMLPMLDVSSVSSS
ncbi:MAG: type II secretion system F family protein [Planctomycetia bacterium]|nr:type II secretion system F family protein [Planctomycetia bacterium]